MTYRELTRKLRRLGCELKRQSKGSHWLATVLLSIPGTVRAEPCQLAVEPAATLLLPYFEVDLADPAGVTTLFSINNAASEPALAHVTLWTDYGIPSIDFHVFLTGFDIVTLNLRQVFSEGLLPVTAGDLADPDDSISPHGDHPQWDGDFDNCESFFPYPAPIISPPLRDFMRQAHGGEPVAQRSGQCMGHDHGDGKVRGYLTVDAVNACDLRSPDEEGYFGDRGTGIASNSNQLWGNFYILDPGSGLGQGEPLVHIQAFDGVGEDGAWQDGDKTFYGRYVDASAIDNREPLPSVFGARYLSGNAFDGSTELLIWRDTESPSTGAVACDATPEWYPLLQRQVYDFDEQEDAIELCFDPGCPVCSAKTFSPQVLPCVPLATQRLEIDGSPPYELGFHGTGWLYLDLNQSSPSQAWVTSILRASGLFSVGLPAVALHSACDGLPEGLDIYPW